MSNREKFAKALLANPDSPAVGLIEKDDETLVGYVHGNGKDIAILLTNFFEDNMNILSVVLKALGDYKESPLLLAASIAALDIHATKETLQ